MTVCDNEYHNAGSVESTKNDYHVLLPKGSYKPTPAKRSAVSKNGTYEIYENTNTVNKRPDSHEDESKWKRRFIISTSVFSSIIVLLVTTLIFLYCLKSGEQVPSAPIDICGPADVLALNTYRGNKRVQVIGPMGSSESISFQFMERTEIEESCSLVWRGVMYIFGGMHQKRQVSKMEGCSLKRTRSLGFDLNGGTCTAMPTSNQIALCFDSEEKTVCRVTSNPDKNKYQKITESNFEHKWIQIASNEDIIFALGSYGNHGKAEMYVHNSRLGIEMRWYATKDYPYHENINAFSILNHKNDFIVFGGNYQTQTGEQRFTSIISMFKTNENSWSEVGYLQTKRHGHQTISVNSNFLVVGGQHDKTAELCQLNSERINCINQGDGFNDFVYYPALVKILPGEDCVVKVPQTPQLARSVYKEISDSIPLYVAQTDDSSYSSSDSSWSFN